LAAAERDPRDKKKGYGKKKRRRLRQKRYLMGKSSNCVAFGRTVGEVTSESQYWKRSWALSTEKMTERRGGTQKTLRGLYPKNERKGELDKYDNTNKKEGSREMSVPLKGEESFRE